MCNKQLSGGSSVCTDDNQSLKLVAYRHIHTEEPYTRLHIYELRCEKTGLRGFRPGSTQTGLYSHRRRLEA